MTANRRGELVSDEEDTEAHGKDKGRAKAHGEQDRSVAWKKSKKTKAKVKHMTYEQIIAESDDLVPKSSLGMIIDATGATVTSCVVCFL